MAQKDNLAILHGLTDAACTQLGKYLPCLQATYRTLASSSSGQMILPSYQCPQDQDTCLSEDGRRSIPAAGSDASRSMKIRHGISCRSSSGAVNIPLASAAEAQRFDERLGANLGALRREDRGLCERSHDASWPPLTPSVCFALPHSLRQPPYNCSCVTKKYLPIIDSLYVTPLLTFVTL